MEETKAPPAAPAAASKEIVKKAESPIASVRALLEKSKVQIQMALPKHMNAERMMRIALTSVQRTPALLECAPITLLGAIIQAAQLGLEPDGVTGQAYLIPFNNKKKNRKEVQFIPGYRGLIALARRSGEILSIEARVVYEKDDFKFQYGLHQELDHKPTTSEDTGEPIYFYAIARMKDGGAQFDVMTKREVDAIRARSKAADYGPWVTDYDEMGKKTVIRRLCKLLPVSIELQKAITLDEKAERELPQDLGVVIDQEEMGTPEPEKPKIEMPKRASNVNANTANGDMPGDAQE